MDRFGRIWTSTARGILAIAIWFLAVEAADPTAARVPIDRLIRGGIAIALALGLVPGSFLDRPILNTSRRAERMPLSLVHLIAVGIPLLLAVLFLAFIGGSCQILQSLPSGASRLPTQWSMIHSAGMGVIGFALLLVNLRALRTSS